MLHAAGSLLRGPDGTVHDLPDRHPVRAASGSVLHDPLRAALRLPAGSGAGLLPPGTDLCGTDLRGSVVADLCGPEHRQLRGSGNFHGNCC